MNRRGVPGIPVIHGGENAKTRRTKITALVVGCAVVAGGAYAASDALSGSAPSGTGSAALSSAPSGASLSGASATVGKASAKAGNRKGDLARLRKLPGEYGQYTFETRKKGEKTIAFERGTITSVSGKTVTVKAANGYIENWTLTSKSAVREAREKTSASALADGRKVYVAGPVSGSAHDARVIVIRDGSARKSAQKSTGSVTS